MDIKPHTDMSNTTQHTDENVQWSRAHLICRFHIKRDYWDNSFWCKHSVMFITSLQEPLHLKISKVVVGKRFWQTFCDVHEKCSCAIHQHLPRTERNVHPVRRKRKPFDTAHTTHFARYQATKQQSNQATNSIPLPTLHLSLSQKKPRSLANPL